MKAAILNTVCGSALVFILGTHYLGLSMTDLALCMFWANCGIIFTLLIALRVQRSAFWGKQIHFKKLKMWILSSAIFATFLCTTAEPVRNLNHFLVLVGPLVLSTGLGILIFGPIQDEIVRRRYRRSLSR